MPTMKIDVDQTTYERLVDRAVTERRPVDWQAEIELQRALTPRKSRRPTDEAHRQAS